MARVNILPERKVGKRTFHAIITAVAAAHFATARTSREMSSEHAQSRKRKKIPEITVGKTKTDRKKKERRKERKKSVSFVPS